MYIQLIQPLMIVLLYFFPSESIQSAFRIGVKSMITGTQNKSSAIWMRKEGGLFYGNVCWTAMIGMRGREVLIVNPRARGSPVC